MMKTLKRTNSARRKINWLLTIIMRLAKQLLSWVNLSLTTETYFVSCFLRPIIWDLLLKFFKNYKMFWNLLGLNSILQIEFSSKHHNMILITFICKRASALSIKTNKPALTYFQPLLLTFRVTSEFLFYFKKFGNIFVHARWKLKSMI